MIGGNMDSYVITPLHELHEIDSKYKMAIFSLNGPSSYETGGIDLQLERFFKGVLMVIPVIENNNTFLQLEVVDNKKLKFNTIQYDENNQVLTISEVPEKTDLSSVKVNLLVVGW